VIAKELAPTSLLYACAAGLKAMPIGS